MAVETLTEADYTTELVTNIDFMWASGAGTQHTLHEGDKIDYLPTEIVITFHDGQRYVFERTNLAWRREWTHSIRKKIVKPAPKNVVAGAEPDVAV